MSPQRSDLILTTDIPDVELDVLVDDRLDVEAHRRNGGDVVIELQLIHDRYAHRPSQMESASSDDLSRARARARERSESEKRGSERVLVLPAASKPSINSRISLDPKTFPIILEI